MHATTKMANLTKFRQQFDNVSECGTSKISSASSFRLSTGTLRLFRLKTVKVYSVKLRKKVFFNVRFVANPHSHKFHERLVLSQMIEHIDRHSIFHERISGYRKGHSTTTVLLRCRDDILRAMKRGELTMAIFVDFSKAFDTVDHARIVKKMHNMRFPKHFLLWILSYIGERRQFVQINENIRAC